MGALYLTESDVDRLIDVPTAIDVVEEAFRQMAAGEASNVPRVRARGSGIVLHTLSASADYLRLVGLKAYTTTREGARFLVNLFDSATGELLAIIEADRLGQLRTGAASGVAAEWLASPHAAEMGLFGTGRQARTQLAALAVARPIRRVFVYSRSEQRRTSFAATMSSQLQIEIVPVDRPQEAVEDLPIVVTATTSPKPLFDGAWLDEGALVCAIGSNWLNRAEIDSATVRRADNIVCDSVDACRNEAGDFVEAIEKGNFNWQRAVDLAGVVSGKSIGRSRNESVVVFKSVGLAIEDVALGGKVLELARQAGLGTPLPF
ncbi:MAG TPA: ornithine cyclodeaminase family protein [Pirellulales bacterium]|jgi:ornithine cyclodeaminase/alanine dehydrogenase-like protein (mu-crystallin family)|nr:ornithine cyclodeaminase family protein [Pirellulales bacterium]